MNWNDIKHWLPILPMWGIFGAVLYGLTLDSIHRLPQRIFAALVAGPFVWVIWLLVWFFRWLFAK
jgi:hypothetical protein